MIRNSIATLLIVLVLTGIAKSQSPAPIIVQPANSTAVASTTSKTATVQNDLQSIAAAIKLLEQLKSANDEILAKQKGALERLDELQEAADQLQIFAKRG
jgi:TolA-binding protein